VTFRDILAVSLRNKISVQLDPIQTLPRLAREYEALATTIKRLSAPCLLISYEKAMQFPESVVTEIADFSGVELSEQSLEQASNTIENGNPQYIQAARFQYQGFVGRLVDGRLLGWVKIQRRDQARVNVELELDGRIVQRVRADIYRPDVEKAGFGDGKYGFSFQISETVSRDTIVNVRIANSTILIKNSGLPLSKY